MDFLCRPLTSDDIADAADVFCSAWQHTFSSTARKLGHTPDTLHARGVALLGRAADGWVAEADGKIVGFCCVDLAEHELCHLAVHPTVMGTGAAAHLLELAEQDLAKHGSTANLWLFNGNRHAQMFFLRHSWQWTGRIRSRPMTGPAGTVARQEMQLAKPLNEKARQAWPDIMRRLHQR